MVFNYIKKSSQRYTNNYWHLLVYLSVLALELLLINQISDLPTSIGGWVAKADELISFQVPSDNFYGPGAAIMWIPFLWLKNHEFLVILFYFLVGSIAYWKLTLQIRSLLGARIAQIALPLNFYLLWLVNSSQDTVFEYCLLLWSTYFLLKRNYVGFAAAAYLLSLTRAGYWTFFLGTTLILLVIDLIKKRNIKARKLIAIPLLIITSFFNYANYGSPSPALEGGMTAYFSYSKYHYLALPKMDMDVFLSGPKGIFSEEFGVKSKNSEISVESNNEYQRAAINSAIENKKETLLGWMQKVDSYIFDVQKIPHLPGRYVLDLENKIIKIENERLTWPLVLGNLIFFLYRTILVFSGLLAVGMFLLHKVKYGKLDIFTSKNWVLSLPYLIGIIPGILFYTETRFKIVSELVLVPLIVGIWTNVLVKRSTRNV